MRAPNGAAILSSSGRNRRAISWLWALRSWRDQKVYLNVGLIGLPAQEIMAHQPVEVVGAGGAGIDLVIRDLGLLAQIAAERLRHAGRLLQRRSVGHVNR